MQVHICSLSVKRQKWMTPVLPILKLLLTCELQIATFIRGILDGNFIDIYLPSKITLTLLLEILLIIKVMANLF